MANFLTVIHECKDFQAWKRVYDAHASKRAEAGLTELHLLREYDNPNLIALMFAVKDVARAVEFGRSPDLAEAMKTGGIIGTPRVRFRHGEYKRVQAQQPAAALVGHRRGARQGLLFLSQTGRAHGHPSRRHRHAEGHFWKS
jgi:hypothetical protein